MGFEPTTSSMPSRRAPNCATAPPEVLKNFTTIFGVSDGLADLKVGAHIWKEKPHPENRRGGTRDHRRSGEKRWSVLGAGTGAQAGVPVPQKGKGRRKRLA
jgi:hypothetical protein